MSYRAVQRARRLWPQAVAERRGAGRTVARLPGIRVLDILCCEDRRGFAGPGYPAGHSVVLVRSGCFLRRVFGREEFIDATGGYLVRPGDEHYLAHPAGPGDMCTEFELSAEVFADRFALAAPAGAGRIATSGRADLQHRALVAASRRGIDSFEAAERVHAVLTALPACVDSGCDPGRRPATDLAHRRLVAAVREVLASGQFTAGLDELARLTGCSPHHLSRIFRRQTGRTLTWYRNQLRVRAVLGDLQSGATCLRTLAARYGFADQAHLTRVVRQHVGEPPSGFRAALAAPAAAWEAGK
jgi:AraC-like DNA-binding protein